MIVQATPEQLTLEICSMAKQSDAKLNLQLVRALQARGVPSSVLVARVLPCLRDRARAGARERERERA